MRFQKNNESGFSLIELMVAAVIAMLSTLVMFQSLSTAEKYKRVTTSGNDSQQGAMLAFDQISFLTRNAGSGIVQTPGSFNCRLQAFDTGARIYPSTATPPAPFNVLPAQMRVAPVMAFDGGAQPDVLVLMMGESGAGNIADPSARMNNSRTRLGLSNTVGIRPNDFLLFSRYQPDLAGNPMSADCILTQATAAGSELDMASGYITANPVNVNAARFSTPAAAMPATADRYAVSTLGATPQFVAIGVRVSGGRSDLVMYDLLTRATPVVLAENVIDFQVVYGVDTSFNPARNIATDQDYFGDGAIDFWSSPTGDWSSNNLFSPMPAGSQGWTGEERQRRVKAIKIGLITYDTENEKTAVAKTTNTISLFNTLGAGVTSTRTIGSGAYVATNRYRTFEFSVPIRNLTSGLSPVEEEFIIR
jgi:Type IV Pilus-assembly protein W/Prokaryotic N-terminal methylation motif